MAPPLVEFVDTRAPRWEELETLTQGARGRVDRLAPDDVRRLGSLYRQAAADLATARRRFPHDPVSERLDDLVRQSRPLVYGTVAERTSVLFFVTTGYWRRVVERPRFLLLAVALLVGPALVVGAWSHANPARAAQVADVSPLTAGLGDGGGRNPDTDKVTELGSNAGFSAQIFTNNARVALMAFAGGLTAGVLTLVSLVFNSLILGLVFGLSIQAGRGVAVTRLVIPHGVLELSLIAASGAAGLRLGWAMLRPGHRTRTQALGAEARPCIELALGSAVLLVPCGLVEGFVTPRGLTLGPAVAVGVGLGLLYWGLVVWRGLLSGERGSDLVDRRTVQER